MSWAPVPGLTTSCGTGNGIAACPSLGVLATTNCDDNTLHVWSLEVGPAGGFAHMGVLGGGHRYRFGALSGALAFTSSAPHLLLVTDYGNDAVHLVDVRTLDADTTGFVATPGSISGPCGIAAATTKPLAAVSAFREREHAMVHVYQSDNNREWTHVRAIGTLGSVYGHLNGPFGVRFAEQDAVICAAEWWNGRVSRFRVSDGGFANNLWVVVSGYDHPRDLAEVGCGAWVVTCPWTHSVLFIDAEKGGSLFRVGRADCLEGSGCGEFSWPGGLAVVPGLGILVRDYGNGRVQVLSTPSEIAMRAMSSIRVAWMSGAFRAAHCR